MSDLFQPLGGPKTYADLAALNAAISGGDLPSGEVAYVTSEASYYMNCDGVATRACPPITTVDPQPDYAWEVDYYIPDHYSNNDPVRQWMDTGNKSGSWYERDFGVSTNWPVYKTSATTSGNPAVAFENQWLDFQFSEPIDQPLTVTIVIEDISSDGLSAIWDGRFDRVHLYVSGSSFVLYAGGSATVTTPLYSSIAGDGLIHTISCVFNGTSSFLRLDATKSANYNPGSSKMDRLRIGNNALPNNPHNLYLFGAYVYRSALSDTQLDDLHSYCQTKWGSE